jgi:hypothetical protein
MDMTQILARPAILAMMAEIARVYEAESIEKVSFATHDDPDAGIFSGFSLSREPVCYRNENDRDGPNEYFVHFFYDLPKTWLCTYGFDLDEHHGSTTGDYRNLNCWAD